MAASHVEETDAYRVLCDLTEEELDRLIGVLIACCLTAHMANDDGAAGQPPMAASTSSSAMLTSPLSSLSSMMVP